MALAPKNTGAVTRWWWVRHAPVPNPEGRCYGQFDKDCDVSNEALFRHQAALLPAGAVWYSSNLLRARKTAEHLGRAGADLRELTIDPDLAEQSFGDWQGLTYAEISEKPGNGHLFWLAPPDFRPPGGESFTDLRQRTVRSIDRLTARHRGENIVATAHGGTIRAALAHAFNMHPEAAVRFEIENVSVTLPGVERPILQDLTFTLDAGGGIGIIGPTGAGKTTLGRLLVGIMAPTRGTVRLDGAELDQWHPDVLGKYIGYLPQEAQLFAGTVAANIARFAANADPSKVVEAAKLASVHEMITRLPGGYDADIGEAGLRLSAGQRQRLALARALYGDPALLVLDEPNSNLDAEGEAALDRAIRHSLDRGAAVAVIAHRPSALVALDRMLVLAEGKIAAIGPRDDILRKVLARPAQGNLVAVPGAMAGAKP